MNLPPPFVPDESVLTGVGASSGIAIGEAQVFNHRNLHLPNYRLSSPNMINSEIARLDKARDEVRARLEGSRKALPPELRSQAGIIDAHLLLLDDPMLYERGLAFIRGERRNAEQAVARTVEAVSLLMARVGDAYISSRMTDVEMVGHSVIAALMGDEAAGLPEAREGCILVIRDISPAEVTKIASVRIAGLATESGGHTSHTAIMAQAMELPAVVGVKGLVANVNDGDTIIIDGRGGHVIIRPDLDALDFYRTRQKMERSFNAEIVRCAGLPAVTLDERRIEVLGNLELVEELPAVMSYGSEGIGLYRTEFLYLNRRELPSEEELFTTYRRVVESTAPNPVVIRTLDLGCDKMPELDGRRLGDIGQQTLGLRGIRYCLRNRGVFKTQLRAILRASAFGEVKIMLPMVSSVDELRKSKLILSEVERSLELDNLDFTPRLPLGIMVEVPATVFVARELAEEAAFFSVGTNDLIQYSLAVDRGDPEVAEMYQPLHPAILRMIQTILTVGRETGTPVSICGDMAAGTTTALILVGLGAERLSMPPAAIPKIKRLIRMSAWSELREWARDVMDSKTAGEATNRARKHIYRKFPELFR